MLTANSRRRLLSDHGRSRELTDTAVVAGTRRGRITVCPLLVSAAARHGRQVCAGGSRALPSWHATAGGRPTRARSARPRWPRVREADQLQLLLPARRHGCPRHGCPRAAALASAEGSAGRDSGCEAKVRRRIRRPSGLRPARTAALNKVLLSAPAQPALLAAFFVQRLSRRLSCSLCLPVPPSSSLPSPFPLTVSRLSLPPSPFVCPWPAFFSSLRSSNVSLSLCPCRLPAAKRGASELDRAKRGGAVVRAHVYGAMKPFFGPLSASAPAFVSFTSAARSPVRPVGTNRD